MTALTLSTRLSSTLMLLTVSRICSILSEFETPYSLYTLL